MIIDNRKLCTLINCKDVSSMRFEETETEKSIIAILKSGAEVVIEKCDKCVDAFYSILDLYAYICEEMAELWRSERSKPKTMIIEANRVSVDGETLYYNY